MTVQELHEIFNRFVDNDFKHLRQRVDWLFYGVIALLGGVIANILLLVFK